MNKYLKYLLPLLILFIVISSGSLLINSALNRGMKIIPVISLIFSFTISTLLSLIIFVRGLSHEADVQAMHTFVAVGIKFLAELFIALIWFVAAKKTSANYI